MTKTEEIQQGKEQLDAAVAAASSFHKGVQAIAVAFGDYTRKSVEHGKHSPRSSPGRHRWIKP